MAHPTVQQLMSTPVIGVSPVMLVSDALELALQHELHHLPVINRGNALGMVCTCDLEVANPSATVSDSMRCPPASVGLETSGTDALKLMNSRRVGSLLVLEGERPVGIVTRRDLQESGLPMSDPRGHCSCCSDIAHLRPHVTGALCAECWDRSRPGAPVDLGGGD